MKKKPFANLLLYRWRYALSYLALIVIFVAVMGVALLYAPGGLSQSEIDMIARTNSLLSGDWAITNLPFHALQALLFLLFGVSLTTIKLPAIILSGLATLSLFFLLRRWFKPGIAVLSLSLLIVTGQFIYLAQSFTPGIIYITTAALILLFASLIIQKARWTPLWKILLAATAAASLYTPFFWYLVAGTALAALAHPYTRYLTLSRKHRLTWLPAASVFAVIVAPLVYGCIKDPAFFLAVSGWSLLGFDIMTNLKLLAHTYLWPAPYVVNGQVLPAIDVSTLALILLGLVVTFRQWHTARAYVIGVWITLSLPLLIIAPQVNMIISVPMFILLASGVQQLLHEWYKLFPKNPYARGTGLLLTVILIGVMTLSGINRYIRSYHNLPIAAREHLSDITLLHSTMQQHRVADWQLLVASPHEQPLYEALIRSRAVRQQWQHAAVSDSIPAAPKRGVIVLTHAARHHLAPAPGKLTHIVTNDRAEAGDRFYLYQVSE